MATATEVAVALGLFTGSCLAVGYVVKGYRWAAEEARVATAKWSRVDSGVTAIQSKQTELEAVIKEIRDEQAFNHGSTLKGQVRNNTRIIQVLEHVIWRSDPRARALWKLDVHGEMMCDRVTQAFTDLTGLTAAQCSRGGWAEHILSSHRTEVIEHAELVGPEGRLFVVDYPLRNPRTGTVVFVHHRAEPIFEHDQTVIAWVIEYTKMGPGTAP